MLFFTFKHCTQQHAHTRTHTHMCTHTHTRTHTHTHTYTHTNTHTSTHTNTGITLYEWHTLAYTTLGLIRLVKSAMATLALIDLIRMLQWVFKLRMFFSSLE